MRLTKLCVITITLIASVLNLRAQSTTVYPGNWWAGMKKDTLQLLVRSKTTPLTAQRVKVDYPGVSLIGYHNFQNPGYLAIDLHLKAPVKPGNVVIRIYGNGHTQTIRWPLLAKPSGNGVSYAQGVTSADLVYLLLTDRFSNGDSTNDRIKGMRDQSLNRDSMYARHGGDFRGILNHMDYFKSLGVTALWLTPVMENNMASHTEHGYAITDYYKTDPRYGSDSLYRQLSRTLHRNGMKLIMDAVYNHMGIWNFLEQDPPDSTWVHRWPRFTQSNYREQTQFDPHAAPSDKKKMTDGWFVDIMPDVNQSNPYMANFLIENMIWYIQTYDIDGIRIDTYTYNDLDFANRCNAAIYREFPKMTIFGEIMVDGVLNQAYFTQNKLDLPFRSNLQGAVDFQALLNGIIPALTQPVTDNFSGVNHLYNTLSQDFIYRDPMHNVLLLDNHDKPRFFSVIGKDAEKQKIGYEWLLTCRGIPQIYYGSEVLLTGFINPDGHVRSDFPGGWPGDKKNAFTGCGLSSAEREVQSLVKKLGTFRKTASALKTGKMMQYVPAGGLYVYFRYDKRQTIMCVMNTDAQSRTVDFANYAERTAAFNVASNVLSGGQLKIANKATIPPMSMWILELKK
jgi:neopullulanase